MNHKLISLINEYGSSCFDIGNLEQVDTGFHNKMAARSEAKKQDLIKYINSLVEG